MNIKKFANKTLFSKEWAKDDVVNETIVCPGCDGRSGKSCSYSNCARCHSTGFITVRGGSLREKGSEE